MEREREMMGFEEKTRTVQDDLDNIAKVGEYYKLTIYIIYIKRWNRNVISYFKLKCGS